MNPTAPDNRFFGRRNIVALLAGSGAFVIAYTLYALLGGDYGSAILFVAMPLLSALLVGMLSPGKLIFRTCFFSLLVNLILSPFMLAEGLFCVIMAAPIFAVVTAIAAFTAWIIRGEPSSPRRLNKPSARIMTVLIAALAAASVWDDIQLRRGAPVESVRTEIEIAASPEEIWKRLSFDRAPRAPLPMWLRPWVAQPERFDFGQTGMGARREADFGPPRYGDDADAIRNKLMYEIVDWSPPDACVFACRENHSRMRRWLDLIDTRVELAPAPGAGEKTLVVFTTRYRRRIGPAHYFVPFLNLAVSGMHGMLAEEIRTAAP